MFDWNAIDFGAVAQGIIYVTLAVLAGLGLKKGQNKPPERPSTAVEVQGALVDSSSVKQLAAAIEAINITLLTMSKNSEAGGAVRLETMKAMVKAVESLAAHVHQTNILTEREEEERERRDRERTERERDAYKHRTEELEAELRKRNGRD